MGPDIVKSSDRNCVSSVPFSRSNPYRLNKFEMPQFLHASKSGNRIEPMHLCNVRHWCRDIWLESAKPLQNLKSLPVKRRGFRFGGQCAVNAWWRQGAFLWRWSLCRITGFGFAIKPECENATERCRRHNNQTADLPPRSMLNPPHKPEEPCYNHGPTHNPFDKIPLRVALDVVVLMPEPTPPIPFRSVWIAHNPKDRRNALVASMADFGGYSFSLGREAPVEMAKAAGWRVGGGGRTGGRSRRRATIAGQLGKGAGWLENGLACSLSRPVSSAGRRLPLPMAGLPGGPGIRWRGRS